MYGTTVRWKLHGVRKNPDILVGLMSSGTGYMLALTADQAERRKALGVIGKRLGLDLVTFDNTPAALSWLMGHDPALVVLDARIPKAELLGPKLRGKKALAALPVIYLSEEMSDVFTANSYAAGADDVIPVHAGAQLAQRLRALPKGGAGKQTPTLGVAVVADANRGRCDLLTRVLSGAGYDVKSAIDERSLQFYQRQHGPKLFVVNSELTDVREAIHASRRDGHDVAWVITASRRELDSLGDALHDASRVVVTGANAPPTDALFLANELGFESQTSRRKGSRKLLGTVVRFREAGTDEEDFGFTYNVSERGVYVRTVAPPEYEEVWLELRPPRAKHWVRLLGRVAWKHPFDPRARSLSPPGFGVDLIAGLGQDLEYFGECFRAFADQAPRGAGRSTFVPLRRASFGFMPRAVPPTPAARSAPPTPIPSSAPAEVRDSWLSPDELESIPPDAPPDEVRDSDWDNTEAPAKAESAPRPDSAGSEVPAPGRKQEAQSESAERVNEHQAGNRDESREQAEAKDPGDDTDSRASDEERASAEIPAEATEDEAEENETGEEDEDEEDEGGDELESEDEDESEDDEAEAGSADAGRPAVFDQDVSPARVEKKPERGGLSFIKLVLIAGVTAGITAAVYTASRSEPGATTAHEAPALTARDEPPPKPATAPAVSPTASVVPSSGAPLEPAPEQSGSAPEPESPFDVASLESDQGALRVTASGKASVFVLGVNRGHVGDWIVVKCGMQFVRLGRGDPPAWVSKGRTVVIPCKKTTTAEFQITE